MPDDESVTPESLPADVPAAPSADAPQMTPSEQAPPSPSQGSPSLEEQKVPYDRFREVIGEKEALARQNQQLVEALQRVAQPAQPVAAPVTDPYAGMDAQTAEFYRNMDRRIEQKAQEIAARQMQPIVQQLDLGRQQLAKVTLQTFYKENPEITPNSVDATAIAQKIQQGYDLEDAKWIVMGPKYHQQLTQQRQTPTRNQAAHRQMAPPDEGPGIPATSGLPQPKEDFRETMAKEMGL